MKTNRSDITSDITPDRSGNRYWATLYYRGTAIRRWLAPNRARAERYIAESVGTM